MTAKSLFVAQLASVIEFGLHADYSTGVQMTAMIAAEHAAELKTCDMHTATAAVPGILKSNTHLTCVACAVSVARAVICAPGCSCFL